MKGGYNCVMHTVLLRSIIWSAVYVWRSKHGRPGISATCHHVLRCHTYLHLPWVLVDCCHNTPGSNVFYQAISIPLYAVSLVNDWYRPDGVLSGLTRVGYRCKNNIVTVFPLAPVSILTCIDPVHRLSAAIFSIMKVSVCCMTTTSST